MDTADFQRAVARDLGELANDPYGFVRYAFPWGSGELEMFRGPDVWQAEILKDVGARILTAREALQIAVASGHGIGKQLVDSERIYLADGTDTTIGQLRVGDSIIGGNGLPCTVKGVYPQGVNALYRVKFSDGTSVLAGAEHLWTVTSKADRDRGKPVRVLSTAALAKNLKAKWQIPMCAPVEWPAQDCPIEPYLMGYMLANGAFKEGTKTVSIAAPYADIRERINTLLPSGYWLADRLNAAISKKGDFGGATNEIFAECARLGLAGKHSGVKFIPREYLRTSSAARIELLRGLMDGDGCCGTRKGRRGMRCVYSTSSSFLRDDMIELVQSLGGTAGWSRDDRHERGHPRANLANFQLTINLPSTIIPFRCAKKRALYEGWLASGTKREPLRAIRSITYERDEHATCITVDNPNGLFLTSNFIVTHNTALVAWLILWSICTFPDARGVVTANTDTQLRTKTWPELAKWYRLFIGKDFFELTATALFAKQAGHDKTWRCDLMPWSERNPEAFAGLHNKGRRILLVFDEASAIVPQIWETAQGALTDADTQILWAAFGNPTRNSGYFRECFGRYRHRWVTRQIDSRTAAMSNKTQIANWVEDYGEDSDLVRIRVRGVFPRTGSTQFISEEAISEAQARALEVDAGAPLVMGVDVARFGDDLSVIRFRRGRDARSIAPLKYRELDTMQLASRVIEQLEVHPDCVAIFIDGNGVGGGVVDRVSALLGRRSDITLFEVQAGGRADSSNDYMNKRAECWGRMREWLKVGVIDADPQLRDDLAGCEYGFDAKNRIQLERKEDMKSRGLASPDNGDTLALTFAETVPRRDISKPKPKITPRFFSSHSDGAWMN